MFFMERFILFGILSVPVIIISWRALFSAKNHGFYRFLSWECIVWLLASNYRYWFKDPFGALQIISWILLIISVYLIIAGVLMMKKMGKSSKKRDDSTLYQFEKTTELVDTGIFNYIRHPLYSSLLFLTWGIYCKHITWLELIIALLSTVFLYLTALNDEKECLKTFGNKYKEYMKRTKKFIPFVI